MRGCGTRPAATCEERAGKELKVLLLIEPGALDVEEFETRVYFPFFMAVMLPGYLAIGPQYYFDALNDRALTPEQISALEDPLVLPALLLFFLAFPIFYAVTCRWWASAYGANIWISALLLFTAITMAGLANFYILSPVVRPFL
jgi:hypothetical protein